MKLPDGREIADLTHGLHWERLSFRKMLEFKHKFPWYLANLNDAQENQQFELIIEMSGDDTAHSADMYELLVAAAIEGDLKHLIEYEDTINDLVNFMTDYHDGFNMVCRTIGHSQISWLLDTLRKDNSVYLFMAVERLLIEAAKQEYMRI